MPRRTRPRSASRRPQAAAVRSADRPARDPRRVRQARIRATWCGIPSCSSCSSAPRTRRVVLVARRRARARRTGASRSSSRSGSGSPCCSRTSPKRWPKGAARRRRTRCASRARRRTREAAPTIATNGRVDRTRYEEVPAPSAAPRRPRAVPARRRHSRRRRSRSKASRRSTRARSPARARPSSAKAAAIARRSPAARRCCPTTSSSASPPTPARRSSTA